MDDGSLRWHVPLSPKVIQAAIQTVLDSIDHAVNHDQRRNAASQKARGCDKGRAEATARTETPVIAECDNNIPLKSGRAPTLESAADLHNHDNFEQAAADGTYQAAGCKEFCKPKY